MHPMVLLVGALLTGGGARPTSAPGAERVVVYAEQDGRRLEGVLVARPETTPPLDRATLWLVEGAGRRKVSERVGAAAFAPDGAILVVRDGALVELSRAGERVLARGLAPELVVDGTGGLVAVVRPLGGGGSAIELVDRREARTVRRLTSGGWNGAPLFAPDGRTLLFASTRTGLCSVWRVGLDGAGERQLTNRGLRAVGAGFVPPHDRTAAPRFEGARLTWTADGERWFVDPDGRAGKVEGGAR